MEDHIFIFQCYYVHFQKISELEGEVASLKKPVLMADVELEDVSGSFQLFVTYDFRQSTIFPLSLSEFAQA